MDAPRVSVIIRTKDRPSLLAEALESLRRQTFSDFEVVLVNDGGTPPPEGLTSPAPGRGLALVNHDVPHGRARALNTGLGGSRGQYVAYLDDDDLYHPEHLATLVRSLDGSDSYRAAYTDVEQVEQVLGEDGRYHGARTITTYSRDFDPNRLLSSNSVPLIGLMHDRALAEKAGGYDETFDLYEDWDFLVRLSALTRFHHVPKVTATYRVRNDSSNATTLAPWHGEAAQAARRRFFAKHWSRHSVESQMALVDSFERETRDLLDEARRTQAEVDVLRGRIADTTARVASLESELEATRADAARQLQSAGERETALARSLEEAQGRLEAIFASNSWRLMEPARRLRGLFKR